VLLYYNDFRIEPHGWIVSRGFGLLALLKEVNIIKKTTETDNKQGKPWTKKGIYDTYDHAFFEAQKLYEEYSQNKNKKIQTKIKRGPPNRYTLKIRVLKREEQSN